MKTLEIKCNKDYIDYINRLLQEVDFDNDSLEMQNLIRELNAKQDDYIGLFSIDINDDYNITIDIVSGNSNYYDSIVIWKKFNNQFEYNEVACLDCEFEIGNDIVLEKEYFDFLDDDYTIKFVY